jgi:hypothetical protein
VSVCCEQLRRDNPSWSGLIYIEHEPRTPSFSQISLFAGYLLPLVDWYFLTSVEVQCSNDYYLSSAACQQQEVCISLPPADDPLSNLVTSIGLLTDIGNNTRQFSQGLYHSYVLYTGAETSSTTFPVPTSIYADASCGFYVPNIVNSAGELFLTPQHPVQRTLSCDYAAFRARREDFEGSLDKLARFEGSTTGATLAALLEAFSHVTTDDWQGCTQMIEGALLQQFEEAREFTETTACLALNASSNGYADDPCCNPLVQEVSCCTARDLTANVRAFEVNADQVADSCAAPECSKTQLNDYLVQTIASPLQRITCSQLTVQQLSKTAQGINLVQPCLDSLFPITCSDSERCQRELGADSVCLSSATCGVPCSANGQCASGTCQDGFCMVFASYDFDNFNVTRILSSVFACLESNVDPYFWAYIKLDLGVDLGASTEQIATQYQAQLSEYACIGLNSGYERNETACSATHTCNWTPCDSLKNSSCAEQYCEDPNIGTEFCGVCFSGQCVELSTPAHCTPDDYENTDATTCQAIGGSYNPLFREASCLRNATNQTTCLTAQFCSSTSSCSGYCYTTAAQAECVGSVGSHAVQWTSWTRDGTNYGNCRVPTATDESSCASETSGAGQWWTGVTWHSGLLSTEPQCTIFGICNFDLSVTGLSTEQDCTSTFTCEGCNSCNTEQLCVDSGTCNDDAGCVLSYAPTASSQYACESAELWTPLGCLRVEFDQTQCAASGGQWVTPVTTREACLSKAVLCKEPEPIGLFNQIPRPLNQLPWGWSFKPAEQCAACGGNMTSYYDWSGGRWVQSRWTGFEWKPRALQRSNAWTSIANITDTKNVLQRSLARRIANIAQSELQCRFGRVVPAIEQLACDCTATSTGRGTCYQGALLAPVVSSPVFCTGVAATVTLSSVVVNSSSAVSSTIGCFAVSVSVVAESQLSAQNVLPFGSVSLASTQSALFQQVRFIKNDAGVAVGEVLGDGVRVTALTAVSGGLTACFIMPSDLSSSLPIQLLDWAVPVIANDTGLITDFELIGLNWSLEQRDQLYCAPVTDTPLIVFPIGLQQDYQTAQYISTFFGYEVFYIFFGLVLYLAVMALDLYHMVIHVTQAEIPFSPCQKAFWNISKIALLILALLLLDRIFYLILLVSGVLANAAQIDVVFSELPTLFFFAIYSMIVFRWAEIYHFTMTSGRKKGITKLRPALIAVVTFLVVLYIVLVPTFFALLEQPKVLACDSVTTSQADLSSSAAVVGLIFKIVLAVLALALSAMFVIYGLRVAQLMTQAKAKNEEQMIKRKRVLVRLIVVSSVCTLCLLAQAASLLYSSFDRQARNLMGALTFIYLVELPAAVIFVVMFKKVSLFQPLQKMKGSSGGTSSTAPIRDSSVQSN